MCDRSLYGRLTRAALMRCEWVGESETFAAGTVVECREIRGGKFRAYARNASGFLFSSYELQASDVEPM